MNSVQKVDVLLVEDNPGDILLTQEALKMATVPTRVSVARDGEEAMRYLRKQEGFTGATTPDMIILDLNLPRMDGREVLAEIKKDPLLRLIPVVVLTSSQAESDINDVYSLFVNSYVVKPSDYQQFTDVVQNINLFWMSVATLPNQKQH